MKSKTGTIDLTTACHLLAISYHRGHRLVLLGELPGDRVDGRWQVSLQAVERLRKRGTSHAGTAPSGTAA
jgi:hypothetical protein